MLNILLNIFINVNKHFKKDIIFFPSQNVPSCYFMVPQMLLIILTCPSTLHSLISSRTQSCSKRQGKLGESLRCLTCIGIEDTISQCCLSGTKTGKNYQG